ncbi:MAG: flagellar assembly protein FliH [Sulfurimonas sp.]|nr:flagellar assembly protein FliH [Sulfurimonas sp.]
MATIISNKAISGHDVVKYNFKVLPVGTGADDPSATSIPSSIEEKFTKESTPNASESSNVNASALSQNSKDSLIESLMKKTDDMSSNFIKMQMKLEDKEEEHKIEIQKAKEEAFLEGLNAGKQQASQDVNVNVANGLAQFSSSVVTLENGAKEFEKALDKIKKDLMNAALDIAKEVIGVELSANSSEIAKKLSDELIGELQSASKITLRVNPKDHGALSESVGKLSHVQILSDSAVSQGGVVATSDAGNIDAQISKRFERVKRAALSE